jgi:hypothetical protein
MAIPGGAFALFSEHSPERCCTISGASAVLLADIQSAAA